MTISFDFINDTPPCLYEGPTLYKRDSTGRVRTWRMQIDENGRYRTVSGLIDGKPVESGWTTPVARSCDTVKDQGEFEVRAKYQHQLDREYHRTLDTIDTPNFFEPMLAKSYDGFKGRGFVQPKLDGIRCIARVDGLFTRQGQPIIAVPHIHSALAPLFAQDPDLILDGELYNHDFREDFGAISSIVRKKKPTADQLEKAEALMQYHVYDIPSEAHLPFGARNEALERHLRRLGCSWIIRVPTVHVGSQALADELHGQFLQEGFEGSMFRLDEQYEQKRSKTLLKRKEKQSREYRLKEFVEGNGNWAGAAKAATLFNDDGSEFGAGIKGSYNRGVQLLNEVVGPKAEVTLEFFELTPDGVPRFPVVVDYHPNGRVD